MLVALALFVLLAMLAALDVLACCDRLLACLLACLRGESDSSLNNLTNCCRLFSAVWFSQSSLNSQFLQTKYDLEF